MFPARRRDMPPAYAKAIWYDRNPISRAYTYGGVIAPHTDTVRFSYTVPAGKKATVELLQARIIRRAVNTTPDIAYATFKITPSGQSIVYLLEAELMDGQNAIKDEDKAAVGTTIILATGDYVQGSTADMGTGGNCYYRLCMKITEFDA